MRKDDMSVLWKRRILLIPITGGIFVRKKDKDVLHPINKISAQDKPPAVLFAVLLGLYITASVLVTVVAHSRETMLIGGAQVSYSVFTGAFTSLGNICIILMVAFYGKIGFFSSLAVLLIQFPVLTTGLVKHHNYQSIPGFFTNVLTIITVILLYVRNRRVQEYQERITFQAVTDQLTELPNRFACMEVLKDLTEKKERFAVVSIDINNFKSINDTLGFKAGNEILAEIASLWDDLAKSGKTGTSDMVGRLGGDEFLILMKGAVTEDDLVRSIGCYEDALSHHLTADGCELYLTASFGYAVYPDHAQNADAVYNCAHAAMEDVKRHNGSGHIRGFTAEILRDDHSLEVEARLRTAIENDSIFFQLQPQYDLSHKLRGFEALARMTDENGNMVSPAVFIPAAENIGVIDKVDSMVFRKAAVFFGELLRKYDVDITLSVNVSVRHLMKNDFMDEVRDIISASGLPADRFEIEITESIMIDSAEKALRVINEIGELGVKIAIDDFGTGYSSLSYLNSFPADLVKVDKSFIDKMNSSDSSKQYVAAIIYIGHVMGFKVISEGVEQDEQVDTLREIGCDYIQGFIWGRPLSADDAEGVVRKQAEPV